MADQLDPTDDGEEHTVQAGEEVEVPLLARGTSVGRYTVLELLGRGGMGAVYKAYDPELDRSIALKVLGPQSSGSESTLQTHGRVMREAQALAQLSHPNVVAVHDVGKYEGSVYIAMELVEGKTGRDWLREGRPSQREVLEVFRQAGEGLLAAHQAGLVHRDFKPGNVILGLDGRVRVADFGLVRSLSAPLPAEMEPHVSVAPARTSEISLESGRYLSASLTLSGRFMGTPHYMSPEQYLGTAIDARTDQFSFCVCLFEALYGARPFEGREFDELRKNVLAGRRKAPAGAGVPEWLEVILEKGLALEPQDRYPSMRELLDVLAADPEEAARRAREGRRRSLKYAGLGAVIASGLVLTGVYLTRGKELCRGGENIMAPVWNDGPKAKIRDAFLATGRSYAADTFGRVSGHLDRWAQEWVGMHRETCEATRVRGDQSEQVLDLRMECLRRKLDSLKVLLKVLSERQDAAGLDKAVEATSELRGVLFCADVKALSQAVPPPESPEARKMVEELRGRLEEVQVRQKLGRYEEARAMLGEVRLQIEALEYRPLVGEFLLQECENLTSRSKFAEAEAAGQEALQTGLEVRDWDLALRAAQTLTSVVGVKMERHQEGLWYSRIAFGLSKDLGDEREARTSLTVGSILFRQGKYAGAEGAYRRVIELMKDSPGSDHLVVAMARHNLGNTYRFQGRLEKAEEEIRGAIELLEKSLGPEHPMTAHARSNLAGVFLSQGKYQEVQEFEQRSLAIQEKALGPDHPTAAYSLDRLALVYSSLGKYKEAEAFDQKALAIREKAFGPGHPDVARSLSNLAGVYLEQGRFSEAEELELRALAIYEKALGPGHPDLAYSLDNLAQVYASRGRYKEAEAFDQKALAIREKAFGQSHPDVARSLAALADVTLEQGRQSEAAELNQRALAIYEKALGPEHADLAHPLVGLAETYAKQSRFAEALPLLERAQAIREKWNVAPRLRAEAAFPLARALWATRKNRANARTLAQEALELYQAAGPAAAKQRREVEQWLAEHR